ncbi:hypothetical protein Indivirus_5_37 [Indivirus ILV1]|uniref:Uncharacterized protein n=1 Tax=Indivirus ILV1 TaxID=1977633 RepID=A0A1V0SE63_9VIRU|nr:hypothetical protein Indivirus_5_37 [Indivirus ILV1]
MIDQNTAIIIGLVVVLVLVLVVLSRRSEHMNDHPDKPTPAALFMQALNGTAKNISSVISAPFAQRKLSMPDPKLWSARR